MYLLRRHTLAALLLLGALIALGMPDTARATLAGSSFDTSNGSEQAATSLSWQSLAPSPALTTELGGTTCFGGGEKETTPNAWTFATGSACTPAKSNILGMWSYTEPTATNTFLHLAFERAATSGDSYITFELNQKASTWVNGAGTTIPCRTNGDLLLSYSLSTSNVVTVSAYEWTGDGSGPASCPNGANGSFTTAGSVSYEGAVNTSTITNYLSTAALGSSFTGGAFGEGSLDLASLIQSLGLGCMSYVQVQAHSRSSSSISSSAIAYMAPVPADLGTCEVTGNIFDDTAGTGVYSAGDSGLAGIRVYVDANGTGSYQTGDPSAVTDADGNFTIPGVPAGTYPLRLALPVGASCTDPSPCAQTVTVSTTTNSIGNTFGVQATAPPAPAVSAPADGSVTTNDEPTFTIDAQANSSDTVYVDGSAVAFVTADGSGTATYIPAIPLTDGSHTVYATATNSFGTSAPSSTNTFTIAAPPAVSGVSPASGLTAGGTTVTVTGTGFTGATAVDFGGIPATGFTVDSDTELTATAPAGSGAGDITVTTPTGTSATSPADVFTFLPPAPTVDEPLDGSTTRESTPTIAVQGLPDASATIEVDGTDFGPISLDASGDGRLTLPSALSDGQHEVRAEQTDGAHETSGWSATTTWTIKTSTTVSLTGPSGQIATSEPTVTYTGEPGTSYTLAIDGHTVATGTVPNSGTGAIALSTPLSDGPHTIAITVQDSVGNTASDTTDITVAAESPTVTIVDEPAGLTQLTTATFSFTGTSAVSYQCALDGASWSPCPSPITYSSLEAGAHTLLVRAVGDAGELSAPAQYAWTIDDASPPAPTILTGPDAVGTTLSALFTISAEPDASLECSLDGGAWQPCTPDYSLASVAPGDHTLAVRQVDQAGNVSPSATYSWTVTAPTGVTSPAGSTGATGSATPTGPAPPKPPTASGSGSGGTPGPPPPTATLKPGQAGAQIAPHTPADSAGVVDVGCSLRAGTIQSCAVVATYKGRIVGWGVARPAPGDHTHALVIVHLNGAVRALLAKRSAGLPLSFRVVVKPVGAAALRARQVRSVVSQPAAFLIPDVLFATASAQLTPIALRLIDQVAPRLRDAKAIVCDGYTDGRDTPAYNHALGLARARSVCAALRAQGLKVRMRSVSFGESHPVATNATAAGRRLNRRVVIHVTYGR